MAAQAGITRQSLSALEAGHSVPSIAVALGLAEILGVRVDELFRLEASSRTVTAQWVDGSGSNAPSRAKGAARASTSRRRAAVGFLNDRRVAHPLSPAEPSSLVMAADAWVDRPPRSGPAKLRLTGNLDLLKGTLFCAGCAPALGILAARSRARSGDGRVVWLDCSSGTSLQMLADQEVHAAGSHLFDEGSSEFNVPEVRRRTSGRAMSVIHVLQWEVGIAVPAGDPQRIRGIADLVRPEVALVARPSRPAVQQRAVRLLEQAGLSAQLLKTRGPVAESHPDAARWVAKGIADAAITLQSSAEAFGLGFLPLARERFDLVVPTANEREPRMVRLLDALASKGFRQDAEALGGLTARAAGTVIARTA